MRSSAAFAGLLLIGGAWAGEVDLATVQVVADAEHAAERADLVHHLTLLAGRAPDGSGPIRFVLGSAPAGATTEPFTAYGRRVGRDIHLWGDDLRARRTSQCRYGTHAAVAGFLETVLGVRWVFPGDDGIVYAARRTCEIADDWNWTYRPPLEKTELRLGGGVQAEARNNNPYLPRAMRETEDETARRVNDRIKWLRRLRHQTRTPFAFGHAFTQWTARFMKERPEFFALQTNGVRGGRSGRRNALCVSNPAVVDQIVRDWIAAGKPQMLNVCPNDTRAYCRCEDCCRMDRPRASDEPFGRHVTDRYVNFWNRIAAKVLAIEPATMLCTYAYSGYREAPRVERLAFPDNFILGMVPSAEDDNAAQIAAWKGCGLRKFILRPNYLCYQGVLPRGYEHDFYENFQLNLREGMVGCDYDAWARGGVTDFESYVVGRVIANPSLSFATLEDEFLSQFGPAKETMRVYFERVRARGERALQEARRTHGSAREETLDDSQLWRTVVRAHPEEALRGDAAVLEEARATAGLAPVERRRIEKYARIVRHAIATRAFILGRDTLPRSEYVDLGLKLLDLRIGLKPLLPDAWGRVMRGFPQEVRWWRAITPELKARYPEMELDD